MYYLVYVICMELITGIELKNRLKREVDSMIQINTLSEKPNTKKIKYGKVDDMIKVEWGTSKFKINEDLYDEILENFFEEGDEWYPLGACVDNPTRGGLGEFLEGLEDYRLNPKHASAIAAIMHNEGLINYRIIGNSIEICKEA